MLAKKQEMRDSNNKIDNHGYLYFSMIIYAANNGFAD